MKTKSKINIKVPVKDYQREIIEGRIENYKKALIRNKEKFEKEQARLQEKIEENVTFWETNKIPVQDFKADNERIQGMDKSKCYETVRVWKKRNQINISTWQKEEEWVCKWCSRPTGTKYIRCEDSRYDESYDICDCAGAKRTGRHYNDLI